MDDAPVWDTARGLVVGGIALAWLGAGLWGFLRLAPQLCAAMVCWTPTTPVDFLYLYLPEIVMGVLGSQLVLGGLLSLRAQHRQATVPPSGWATPLGPGVKAVKVKLVAKPLWRRLRTLGVMCTFASAPVGLLISLPLALGYGADAYLVSRYPEYRLLFNLVVYPPLIGIGVGLAMIVTAVAMHATGGLREPARKTAKSR